MKDGFGWCKGNGLVTELVLIAIIITNLLLAFCLLFVLAIERVKVESTGTLRGGKRRIREREKSEGEWLL